MDKFKSYLKVKSVVYFSILNYLQAGFSFAVSFLMAREFSKEEYSIYALGLIFSNSYSTLIQFGMEKTLVRDLVQRKDNAQILSASIVVKSIALIPLLLFLSYYIYQSGFVHKKAIVVILAALSGIIFGYSPKAWFDQAGKLHLNAKIALSDRFLFFIVAISILYGLTVNYNDKILIIVSFGLFVRIVFLMVEWSIVLKNIKVKLNDIRDQVKFILNSNVFVWLAGISNMFMTQGNQLILEAMKGGSGLSLYALAFQIIMVVRLLQTQLIRLMTPSIANIVTTESKDVLRRKLFRFMGISLGFSFVFILPLFFFGDDLILHVVGDKYLESIEILRLLLIWIVFYGIAIVNNQFLLSLHLNKQFFVITVFSGTLSLILSYYFIDYFGPLGAAISLLVSHGISIIGQVYVVLKKISEK